MSYPDARYLGDEGEISATFRPADQEPELTIGSGTAVRYLATGASTNGRYGLYGWKMRPHTSGARAHFHKTMSESFFILSGTVRLFNGERWIDATAGDFLYVPEGGVHAFHNEADEPASMLILFAPGGPREAGSGAGAGNAGEARHERSENG
jgi:mannose-6-phosphate isomerase-like protein (cupin superfamily)